jgi:hypothetical protein
MSEKTKRERPANWGVIDCESIDEEAAKVFALRLLKNYDEGKARNPIAFQVDLYLNDLPHQDRVISGAVKLLRQAGWSIDFNEFTATSGRAGMFAMCAPDNDKRELLLRILQSAES